MDENVEEHIEELIRDDKDKELLSFLTSGGKQVCDFSPTKLLKLICKHNARYCLVGLLEDEENFSLDVNMELEGGLFPLHLAAQSLSFDIIDEFLERGAQANVCDERGSKDLTKLPLNLALQAISDRCVSNWSPEKSIYKLLYIFCLQDVEDPLSTATLLSEQTEDIENLALYYVEEGKVVQLAALLFCAWDRLMPPNVEDVEKSIVGQDIWTQVARVYDQEFLFMTNCGPRCPVLETLMPTKINLVACWKFVKIFEIARGVINKYRNSRLFEAVDDEDVPYVVAHRLLEHTDLVLRTDDVISDDIESLKIQFTAKEKARVLEAIEKRMQSWAIQSECKTQDVADQSLACFPKESFAASMEAIYDYNKEGKRCGERSCGYGYGYGYDDDDHWDQVKNSLKEDSRELFVKLINTIPSEQLKLSRVRSKVMYYDAVNCLAAVLAGETKISAFTFLLDTDQLHTTPLHTAASKRASRIIVLLLNHGFSPNFRCCFRGTSNCLPLTAFFYEFGQDLMEINRKARTSAVTLIAELFRTQQKPHLEAVRMLALHTRELKRELVNYLKQGRLVEVGALLLVAKSCLLSPPTSNEEKEHDVGFQSISEMHDFLLEAKASSQAHSHLGVIAIDETLLLLKIFDKIGDKLSALIRLNFDQIGFNFSAMSAAVSLIEDAGFDVPDYAVKPHLPTSILRFQSNVFERAVDDGKKMAVTTDMLARRQKEVAARGLGDKYDNKSRICNNSISGSVQEINPACLQIPSQNMTCHHLIKQASRLQGTLKRVSRLA